MVEKVDGFDVGELRALASGLGDTGEPDGAAIVRAAADHIEAQGRELVSARADGKKLYDECVHRRFIIADLRADLAAAQSHARDYDALVDTLAAERKLRVEAEAARASAWEAEKAAVWQVENATAHLQRLIPAEPNMSLNLGMLCCQVDHSLAAAREECERLKSAKHWQDAIAERARLIADLNRYHVANVKLLSAKDAAVAELADIDKVLDESFVRPHRLRRDTMIGNLIDGLNSNHEENVKLETALAHERAIVAQLKEALRGCECANCKSVSASRAQQGGE